MNMNVLEMADKLVDDVSKVSEGAMAMKQSIIDFGNAKFNEGWDQAMAQAGSAGTSDKIYSEEEMNHILADEKEPLIEAISQLQAAVDAKGAEIEAAKAEAVAALKADLKAQLEAQQASENAGEANFAELLK